MTIDVAPLWSPSAERRARMRLTQFLRAAGLDPDDYAAAHRWSVDHLEEFWQRVFDEFGVRFSTPPTAVLGDRRMPGAQ